MSHVTCHDHSNGHKLGGSNAKIEKILERWYHTACLTYVDLKANIWSFKVG